MSNTMDRENRLETAIHIFDIERYATKDGPGIRTVIFFKGCNLRCAWCQNPESQLMKKQVMYYRKKCSSCGRCISACPCNAVIHDPERGFLTLHDRCTACGACVDACFYDARKIAGVSYTVDSLMREIMKDKSYYKESDGGVTFSGGEPLLQPAGLEELSKKCSRAGIHTALETAGHAKWEVFKRIIPFLNMIFFDIKHIDPDEHARYTGVSNERILDNLVTLSSNFENIIVRIPVIPGVNDNMEIQKRIFSFLRNKTGVHEVELLPFHRLGAGKYSGLGMDYQLSEEKNMPKEACVPFAEEGIAMGLAVHIGAV